MNNLFVPHLDHDAHLINQIDLGYARTSLYTICGILMLLIIFLSLLDRQKFNKTSADSTLFSINSTLILKGLAIILLLLGHVSQQCTSGSEALPFRITGNAAVIIFLFVSGIGLAKQYRLHVDSRFWFRRIKKLASPVWLSLILVVPLNFLLLKHTDPPDQSFLNFLGIFWTKFPNSPCWFITYIIFLYTVYFIAAKLPINRIMQITVLFLLSFFAAAVVVKTGEIDHFKLWPQYSLIFPAGVVCGLNAHHLKKINDKLFAISPLFFIVSMVMLLGLYWTGIGVYRTSHLISSELYTNLVFALVNPVPFILFLTLLVGWLETRRVKSSILEFFGQYSFELYLLHFPFMVNYDFFIFRKPLVFFFFVYTVFILFLSVLLQKSADFLNRLIFN